MKLTKAIREEITAKALTATFGKRDDAHAKARKAFADALYKHEHGDIERLAMKLPQEWRAMHNDFRIECDGFRSWGKGDGAPRHFEMSRSRPFPMYQRDITVGKDHGMYDQAQAIAAEHDAIEAANADLRVKLHALLNSVTTVEKLKERWPECVPFLPTAQAKAVELLPVNANLAGQINVLMGIRPSKAKAAK